MGFGTPPGPPLVSASMNNRTITDRLAVLYSSIKFLKKEITWKQISHKNVYKNYKYSREKNRPILKLFHRFCQKESSFWRFNIFTMNLNPSIQIFSSSFLKIKIKTLKNFYVILHFIKKSHTWRDVICSIILKASVWLPLRRRIWQLLWMVWVFSRAAKNSGVIFDCCRSSFSWLVNWNFSIYFCKMNCCIWISWLRKIYTIP